MLITNANRKKPIEEFIDENHAVINEYSAIYDRDMSREETVTLMRKLIKKDPDFFDSYHTIIEALFEEDKIQEAITLLKEAYQRALTRIVDKKGRWPKRMEWGWRENRHLMRIIETYSIYCWQAGNTQEALTIFRNLLKVCPGDNLGARFNILAIHLGLSYSEWYTLFKVENSPVQGLDGIKLYKWFQQHAKKFSDDLHQYIEDDDLDAEIE